MQGPCGLFRPLARIRPPTMHRHVVTPQCQLVPWTYLHANSSGNPREVVHGGVCALFYVVTGSLLINNVTDIHQTQLTRLVLTSGIFCLLLALVFIVDMIFVGWKWRRTMG
ncbi:unnamed protein product [Darwinula stevensoni]|uniref:Uncharacterized protein n=1 Tax=Darwinula stevensoni TaxID=69355 RepID=A0A7R8XHG4_9CRUS|nr:unnamed protein product [Darwinula stevensoni]CAG0892745.1 unnamed protein product [Darwinula stevensoni]